MEKNSLFQRNKVGYLFNKFYFGLNGSNVALDVPWKLERAVNGFAQGDRFSGIIAEPFVKSNIHTFDSALYFQEVALRAWNNGGNACDESDAVDAETKKQKYTGIDFQIMEEEVPDIHGDESKENAKNKNHLIVYHSIGKSGKESDDEAWGSPWNPVQ